MKVQISTKPIIFPNPQVKEPVSKDKQKPIRVLLAARLGVLCLCANLFVGPGFADNLSTFTELNAWQKKIKEPAERGDMDLADRNAVAAMQSVCKNPTAYDRSMVNFNIFMPVKDLISSYRKNRRYDRANYMNNWLYGTEEKMYGAKSIELLDPLTEFAKTLEAQDKNTEAEGRYRQAIAIADKAPYLDTLAKSRVMMACWSYSALLKKMGRDKESQTMMESFKKYQ